MFTGWNSGSYRVTYANSGLTGELDGTHQQQHIGPTPDFIERYGAAPESGSEELASNNYPLECSLHELNATLAASGPEAVRKLFNAEKMFANTDILVIAEHSHKEIGGPRFV